MGSVQVGGKGETRGEWGRERERGREKGDGGGETYNII